MFKFIKKNLLSFIFILFTFCLIIFSKTNLTATKSGLELWFSSVVPALLPFFIATELLGHTNVVPFLGRVLNKFMRPVFNVPGVGAFALVMGIISGYPVGAKIVTNFRQENICTKEEAERLLCFTNNSGPLFILGTVGISLFGDTTTGVILFATHLLSCLTVGFLFRFWKCNKTNGSKIISKKSIKLNKNLVCFSNLGEVLSASINSAISTVIMIGGFVVLFSVIISILNYSHMLDILCNFINPVLNMFNIPKDFSLGIISGIIELTNGVKNISTISCKAISTNIIITAFLLGFGGFSVLLQVWGIISKTDISIFPYFIAKFIQGCFAAFYTYLVLSNFKFFSLDLNMNFCKNYSLLFLIILFTFLFLLYKFNKKKILNISKEH